MEHLAAQSNRRELIDSNDSPIPKNRVELEAERIEIAKKLEQVKQKNAEVIQKIREQDPRYGELDPLVPITVEEIQNFLDDDTLLLEYWSSEQASYLWVVSKDNVKAYNLQRRQEQIDRSAKTFYEYLTSPDLRIQPNNRLLAGIELSRIVLEPALIDQDLRGKRLLIVADGQLQRVPFSALPMPQTDEIDWDNRPDELLRHSEVINIPSASALKLMRERIENRDIAPKALALVYDSQLIGAEREGRVIKEEADDEGIGDPSLPSVEEFDASVIRNIDQIDLGQYRLIHFAMHGVINDTKLENSGLTYSSNNQFNSQNTDFFLKLADVFELSLSADLVVLSGCRTGLGSQVPGEGLLGLTKGFTYAGAERVLVSLWSVNDSATAALMENFYNELIDHGKSPSEALRKAQQEMLDSDEWGDPYNWAGFILQGEWENFRQKL